MDNIKNPLLVLAVYHQLIQLSDTDEIQERLTEEQCPVHVAKNGRVYLKPDSQFTLYRYNHLTDESWNYMTSIERRAWVDKMVKQTGKSVVW